MASFDFSAPNFRVSNEARNITFVQRSTIPISPVDQTPVQREGSLIYDPSNGLIFYSNGIEWVPISSGGGPMPVTPASVQTTNATPTLLQTIPLDTASRVYLIEIRVTARSGSTGASYIIEGTYKRDAGTTVSVIGLPFRRQSRDDTNWMVSLIPTTSGVDVIVTGVPATTIDWNSTATIQLSQ
jgi:hypothetical protein